MIPEIAEPSVLIMILLLALKVPSHPEQGNPKQASG